jgi:hypothetical protein
MPKPKEDKPVKAESNPIVENIKVENEQIEEEGAKDSPKPEGNQPESKEPVKVESESKPEAKPDVKDSDKGQPVKVEPKADDKEIAAAISKANEKTSRELDLVAGLLRDNPEKLQELQEKEPKLFEKLQRRIPDLVIPEKEDETPAKVSKLSEMLKALVKKDEERDFEDWRDMNGIADADFKERKAILEDNARTLYDEGVVKDWNQAIHFAGKIVFPHLDTKPVDNTKLSKLRGQSSTPSKVAPAKSGMSEEDYAIMKREGMTEDDYKKTQTDEIFAPGII